MLKLLERDMPIIRKYIEEYGHSFDTPSEDIDTTELSFDKWAHEKKELFKLLGNKLILDYPTRLCIENDPVELMTRSLVQKGTMRKLYDKLKTCMPEEYHYDLKHLLLNPYTLAYNKVRQNLRLPLSPAKDLDIPAGARPLRVIQKLAKAYDLEEYYKLFQRDHSLVLGQTHIEGTLHLSIHPMDFLTCSDNNYKWSSCMTVQKMGDYRAGVIEMLNSPIIVEAYVNGDDAGWFSKKWRSFFIVCKDAIVSIRAYPYENSALTEKCGRWLAELAGKNWGINFPCEDAYLWHDITKSGLGEGWQISADRTITVNFNPDTEILSYPDEFRIGERHFGAFSSEVIKNTHTHMSFNHYGESICPICGEPLEFSFQLLCEHCAPYPVCDKCGRPITAERDLVYIDGDSDEKVCVDCYEDAIDLCSITNEIITDWVEILLEGSNFYITIGKETFTDKSIMSKYFKAAPHILDDEIAHPEYWIEPENLTELGRKLYNLSDPEAWEKFLRDRPRY